MIYNKNRLGSAEQIAGGAYKNFDYYVLNLKTHYVARQDLRKEDEGEMKYYWFTFADGYSVCVKGFSKQELRVEENKHGKLLRKVEA